MVKTEDFWFEVDYNKNSHTIAEFGKKLLRDATLFK